MCQNVMVERKWQSKWKQKLGQAKETSEDEISAGGTLSGNQEKEDKWIKEHSTDDTWHVQALK